jgi:hypothetical protein
MGLDNDDYEVSGSVLDSILFGYEMGTAELRHGVNWCGHLIRDFPLVPRSRMVELYLNFSMRLIGVAFN